jgi:hypothetical protein
VLTQLSWRAILIGAFSDIALSMLLSAGLLIIFSQMSGVSSAEPKVLDQAFQNSILYWVGIFMGVVFSGLGGFIAGWLANKEYHLHGLISAFITNVIFTVAVSADSPFTVVEFGGAMLGLLAGLAGGLLAGLLKNKRVASL